MFVPHAVSRASHFSEETLFAPYHDYKARSFIECDACGEGKRENPPADVTFDQYRNGDLQFSYDAAGDTWIVVSESKIPGWRAILDDGTPLAIETANGIYMGFRVPKGEHRVRLSYELPKVRELPTLIQNVIAAYRRVVVEK